MKRFTFADLLEVVILVLAAVIFSMAVIKATGFQPDVKAAIAGHIQGGSR